jgi:hypothetical protein
MNECVYCAARTESRNIFQVNIRLGVKISRQFINTPSVFMKQHISLDTMYININKRTSVKRYRIYPEDGDNRLIRNKGMCLQNYTLSHHDCEKFKVYLKALFDFCQDSTMCVYIHESAVFCRDILRYFG